jgi:hypothetical protein
MAGLSGQLEDPLAQVMEGRLDQMVGLLGL